MKRNKEMSTFHDNRDRIVLATISKHENGKYCFGCCSCDAEFLNYETLIKHIEHEHPSPTFSSPYLQWQTDKQVKVTIIKINDSDDEDEDTIELFNSEEEASEIAKNQSKASTIRIDDVAKEQNDVNKDVREHTIKMVESKVILNKSKQNMDAIKTDSESVYHTAVSSPKRLRDSDGDSDNDADEPKTKRITGAYKCDYCPIQFTRLIYLNKHLASDCENYKKLFIVCDFCSKHYRHITSKYEHMRKEHIDKLPHICKVCPRAFRTHSELMEHSKKMHSKGRVVPCNFCKKQFSSCYERNNHVRERHHNMANRLGEFVCPICDYTCKTKNILDEHKRDIHQNQK